MPWAFRASEVHFLLRFVPGWGPVFQALFLTLGRRGGREGRSSLADDAAAASRCFPSPELPRGRALITRHNRCGYSFQWTREKVAKLPAIGWLAAIRGPAIWQQRCWEAPLSSRRPVALPTSGIGLSRSVPKHVGACSASEPDREAKSGVTLPRPVGVNQPPPRRARREQRAPRWCVVVHVLGKKVVARARPAELRAGSLELPPPSGLRAAAALTAGHHFARTFRPRRRGPAILVLLISYLVRRARLFPEEACVVHGARTKATAFARSERR